MNSVLVSTQGSQGWIPLSERWKLARCFSPPVVYVGLFFQMQDLRTFPVVLPSCLLWSFSQVFHLPDHPHIFHLCPVSHLCLVIAAPLLNLSRALRLDHDMSPNLPFLSFTT